ncbi:MAG: hypothetical protein AB7J13_03655 [Pyrinomonadaceae bacterium]
MKWVARIFVFTAALTIGAVAAAVFSGLTSSGLSDCVVKFEPRSYAPSEPPKGVQIMYAGWLPESEQGVASLRFVVYNGLDVPVIYTAYSPNLALPEVHINGKKYEQWRCLNGSEKFRIAPGASAEIHATRWDFPRRIAPNAKTTVGLYLNFLPGHGLAETQTPDILAVTEPFPIPNAFRTARLP